MSKFAAWRRLDRPGCDAASLQPIDGGWLLRGAAAFDHEGGSAAVAYLVETDSRWRTKRGLISGFLGGKSIQHEIERDLNGWRLDGVAAHGLERLVDLDFGFTPATNLLQLSRIALKPGESAEVPIAWFDLDSASLIELPQSYERRSEAAYWYEAPSPLSGPARDCAKRLRSVLSGSVAAC